MPTRSLPGAVRLVPFTLTMLVWLSCFASPASAHARLTESSPASGSALPTMPSEIVLSFSEQVDLAFSAASLLTTDETSVALGALSLSEDALKLTIPIADPSALPPGTYSLVWRVLSAVDGHVTTGVIAVSAGTGVSPNVASSADARPPWWRLVMRWLQLVAVLSFAGLFLFAFAIVRTHPHDIPGWSRLATASALLLIGLIPLSAYDAGIAATSRSFFDPPSIGIYIDLLGASTGRAWWTLSLSGLCTCAWAWLVIRRRTPAWPGFAFATLALLSISAAGHAAAASPSWLGVGFDWLHLIGAGVWLGSLPVIVYAIRNSTNDDAARLAAWLSRFSWFGLASMAVIIVTGFVRANAQVAGGQSLGSSDYGRVLIAKHLLLLPVLIAAGVNLLLVVPRLRNGDRNETAAGVQTARRFVTIELGGAIAILLAAAGLTLLPPADAPLPVDVAAKTVTINERANAGDISVWMLARLDGGSTDRFTLTLADPAGAPPGAIQRVIVTTSTSVGDTVAGDRFDADPLPGSPGSYAFPALRLGLRSVWDVSVTVRRAGVEDVTTAFAVDTTDAGALPPRLVADEWNMPRVTIPSALFVALGAIIFAGGLALVRLLPGVEPFAGSILLTMTVLIASGFAVQGVRQTVPVTASTDLTNPLAGDAGAITRGAETYTLVCLACHGPGGIGIDQTNDPEHPHTAGTDLTDRRTQSQRDGDLYAWITAGIPGTDMPAYDLALTDAQRWELVAYLRTLRGNAGRGTPVPAD